MFKGSNSSGIEFPRFDNSVGDAMNDEDLADLEERIQRKMQENMGRIEEEEN